MVVQNATQAASSPAGRALTLRLIEIIALVLPLLGILLQVTSNQMRERYAHKLPDKAQLLLAMLLFGIIFSGVAGAVLTASIILTGVPLLKVFALSLIALTFLVIYLGGLLYFAYIVADNQQKTLSADAAYLEDEGGDSDSSAEESPEETSQEQAEPNNENQ